MGKAMTATASLAALVTVGGAARAADCSDPSRPAISTCINSDTLWPHAGPQRFASIGGTETVAKGQVGFGLVTTWQNRPIVLRVATPGQGGSDQYAVDQQVNGNFLWTYGLTNELALDVAMPVTLYQRGVGLSPLTGGAQLQGTTARDLRFGVVYALPRPRVDVATQIRGKDAFQAAARFEVSAPTGDRSQFAGERTAVFVPTAAVSYRFHGLFAGAEIGARIRPTTNLVGARVGAQGVSGLGVGYDILPRERLAILAEARALFNFAKQATATQKDTGIVTTPSDAVSIPAEWSVGVRSAALLAGDLSLLVAGGGALPTATAITTPRFRFTFGVVFAPLGRDSDRDGVLDRTDRCPDEAQAPGPGPRDGCNHPGGEATAPPRADGPGGVAPPRSVGEESKTP